MSSPTPMKLVKQEEDNISNVATDDSETEDDDICIDKLQLLDSKFASDSKFPVGCKIWYDALKSRASKVLRAKSGCVTKVYFDFQSMRHVYRVKSCGDFEHMVYQDRLMFGINCPVSVTNSDNEAKDGVIVVPKIDFGNDSKPLISYAVQFTEGRHVSVEFLVAAERIKYRHDKSNELDDRNDGMEDKKETNDNDTAQEGDVEMKESKIDTKLGEKTAVSKNEGGKLLPRTTPPSTAADESRITTNVGEAGNSLVKIAKNKKTDNHDVVRSVASNEYSKLADINVQQIQQQRIQQTLEGGLQSKRDRNVITATTAPTPSTRIDQQEPRSSPLGTSRWKPPAKEKSPQGKGDHGLEGGGVPSLERKRSSGSEVRSDVGERPNKMVKTETISDGKGSERTLCCTLTIPQWVYQIRGRKHPLFLHIIGVKNDKSTGYKTKRIESMAGCKICISGKHHPMKIDITSKSIQNVAQGISMIEESLMEFVSDENSEKRMLYELVSTAEGSFKFKRNDSFGMLYRNNEWWALFELPYNVRGNSGQYHGKFLTQLQPSLSGDCRIELFGDTFGVPLEHTSPFVLIRGTKHKDVKDAVSIVRDKMRRHQNRGPGRGCDCMPKW